jgi:RNA polymerase sigma factor (sigma-70 family)
VEESLPAVLRYLQALYSVGTLANLTDQELLERFKAANRAKDRAGAEVAFTTLVERHAPMVWRVCRSLVRDVNDAEDAFQATFLILVRKSDSLRSREALGPWLYVVAYRTALSTRSATARRRAVERAVATLWRETADPAGPSATSEASELRALIHSEISKLPGSFRAVVVLCDLEGLSYLEAATRLNLPLGTIQSRLARARRRLRRNLTRRGLSPPASPGSRDSSHGSMLAIVAGGGLPRSLARQTCRLAVAVASRPASMRTVVAGSIPALIEGDLRRMFLSKLGGAMVTMTSGLFLCAALFYPNGRSDQPPPADSRGETASTSEPVGRNIPAQRAIALPAPRNLKVAAGRGGVLTYALGKNGDRIPVQRGVPDRPAQEVVRDLRWAVVTGIIDHRRIQELFSDGSRSDPGRAEDLYRRVDLERQVLQRDGTWSRWEPVDVDAKLEILDNLPEVEEERVPEALRVSKLVDPLPLLKTGAWKGVDIEDFVPPQEADQQDQGVAPGDPVRPPGRDLRKQRALRRGTGGMMGGMMPARRARPRHPQSKPPVLMLGPPVLMLRQFDFTVEAGRTYRYRARVVVDDTRRRADRSGAWSESTDVVTVPGTPPDPDR